MVECECWKCSKSHNHEWVLIDTWWNVNQISSPFFTSNSYSFNRYMVECELFCLITRKHRNRVLIDTWWNVNDLYPLEHGDG